MKILSSSLTLIIALAAHCQTIQDIRNDFHKAVLDKEASRTFHSSIIEIKDPDATVLAYQAVPKQC